MKTNPHQECSCKLKSKQHRLLKLIIGSTLAVGQKYDVIMSKVSGLGDKISSLSISSQPSSSVRIDVDKEEEDKDDFVLVKEETGK